MKIAATSMAKTSYNVGIGKTDMHKLTAVVFVTLLAASTVSMAHSRKTVHKPRHAAAVAATQDLLPEAVAMREAQKFWPNVPLCDEGGYRIRPCYLGGSRR